MLRQDNEPTRHDGRKCNELRKVFFNSDPISPPTVSAPNPAYASVISAFGDTRVLCSASLEKGVPAWMKAQNSIGGWMTAEYAMLPCSTRPRKNRDISRGKIDGRSLEIQRLIGRSMRSAVDLHALGKRTLWLDCDVLEADGGTRCASITGACLAAAMVFARARHAGLIQSNPLRQLLAAVSVGLIEDMREVVDLDYHEDSRAAADINVVMDASGGFVEILGGGERSSIPPKKLSRLIELAETALREINSLQKEFIQKFNALDSPFDRQPITAKNYK